jgi:hypothetical protein
MPHFQIVTREQIASQLELRYNKKKEIEKMPHAGSSGNIFSGSPGKDGDDRAVLPLEDQLDAWRKAARKMRWNIGEEEFGRIDGLLPLTVKERVAGFTGTALFYGFGDDHKGHSDAVLSGKLAWDYARKKRKKGTIWQSPYVDFERPDAFRLRPAAPARPRGFYLARVRTEGMPQRMPVSAALKSFSGETGWGPEGFQFLCVTHTHFPDLMSERKVPFMALADYEVAPYGFNDFIDAPQLFSSNGILGLGIGNVDQGYEGFVVPSLVLLGP